MMLRKRHISYVILTVLFLLVILNLNTIIFLFNFVTDQVKIISRSEDINVIINNNMADVEIISQLRLIPEIMQFGDDAGFPKTDAYLKYFPSEREVFYHSLSASKKDKFAEYVWRWPFIGALPYKGFIHKKYALKEEQKLKSKGYDTYVGKSSAMSTLGILPDPITTTMINKNDTLAIINTIFHERTHQLFFKQNHVNFNENSAVLLGTLTTLEFIKNKFGANSTEYLSQLNRIQDILIFSKFIDEFYQDLDILYLSNLSFEEKIIKREIIFRDGLDKFKILKKNLSYLFKNFDKEYINNAYILSKYRYYGRFNIYYEVYEKLGNNLQKTINFFNNVSNKKEPDEIINNYIINNTNNKKN